MISHGLYIDMHMRIPRAIVYRFAIMTQRMYVCVVEKRRIKVIYVQMIAIINILNHSSMISIFCKLVIVC